ncbi:MAG: 8-amino-7-oxononanoate synthase [Opitutales bacterium]|nr:8-amino-7-oxononanoate synthase [Opitutales bacterium]
MFEEIDAIKKQGLYRSLKTFRVAGAKVFDGRKSYLNFSSNDYLGIASRLDFQEEFLRECAKSGEFLMGSTSSRLLVGSSKAFEEAEAEFSAAFNKSCLLFNSGYHANTGIIPALCGEGDLILADKLAHASLIDCLKLSGAKWLRFAHNDMDHLKSLLEKNRPHFRRAFIITESVFSMDGDFAPLKELVEIKNNFGAMLYVDEAHGFGVFGEGGLGRCAALGLAADVDFIMCTLGKALASEGAFVACSEEAREMLVNRSRSLIFTTAMPPLNVLWTLFSFRKMRKMDFERRHLGSIAARFRNSIKSAQVLGGSQIVPAVVGDAAKCVEIAKALAQCGVMASAVRYPTVAKNSARIRFSLSAALSECDVDFCAQSFNNIFNSQ